MSLFKSKNGQSPSFFSIHYRDFAKSATYINTDDNSDKDDLKKSIEEQKGFVIWVQEFSKKIVTGIFFVYLGGMILSGAMIAESYFLGSLSGIDTFISELNQTFRDVVGGYIVKSAVENSFKIIGNYLIGLLDSKLNSERDQMVLQGEIDGAASAEEVPDYREPAFKED